VPSWAQTILMAGGLREEAVENILLVKSDTTKQCHWGGHVQLTTGNIYQIVLKYDYCTRQKVVCLLSTDIVVGNLE